MFTLIQTNYQGELKNPLENKNKHIRSKGPKPNIKRTIFAVLGVTLSSPLWSLLEEVTCFGDFLLGILKLWIKYYNSSVKYTKY